MRRLAGTAGSIATVFVTLLGAQPQVPVTRVDNVIDTMHGVAIVDPYRWLEDQNSRETREWLATQARYAEEVIGPAALRTGLASRLRELMDHDDIGRPQRGGGHEYFEMRRRGDERAAVYRRPAPKEHERIDPARAYELVIDPRTSTSDSSAQVELVAVEQDARRLVYSIRDGGEDEVEIRVRDLASGTDLPDRLPRALYDDVSFSKGGDGLYYARRSRQTGGRIYFHKWGQPLEADAVVFGEGYGPTAFVSMSQEADGRYFVFTVQHGWARSEVFVLDTKQGGAAKPVAVGLDARFYPRVVDSEIWMRTDLDASNNRIVAVDLSNPSRDRWRVVIPEGDDVMDDFVVIGGRVYVSYLRNASSRIRVFEKDGRPAGEIPVPEFHTASIRPDGDAGAFLTLESFTAPKATWRLDLAAGTRTLDEERKVAWDGSPFITEQVWATSADGTRVPVFVTRRKDMALDGSTPLLLFGYGGFYVANTPHWNPLAAAWLEQGGAYAVAVIRGGSEFGERWHRAGMLTRKPRVFDDFIAAAEWLVASKYTRPDRLAITGVSNGGLLVGAALTRRPDLFRAVICGFPDVDILGFPRFTTNNNMPALLEYGDSTIKEQFEAIREYSPYQNVRAGVPYPAVLITSGDLDTRVPPLSARKFAARLQAATSSGRPVVLRYYPKGGHATNYGMPFSLRVEDAAAKLAFLTTQLQSTGARK